MVARHPALHAQATEVQNQRYAGDPWQQAIEGYIAGKASVSVCEITLRVCASQFWAAIKV